MEIHENYPKPKSSFISSTNSRHKLSIFATVVFACCCMVFDGFDGFPCLFRVVCMFVCMVFDGFLHVFSRISRFLGHRRPALAGPMRSEIFSRTMGVKGQLLRMAYFGVSERWLGRGLHKDLQILPFPKRFETPG